MGELVDLKDKIRRYYRFTKAELTGLVFSILMIGFIISFKEWGASEFNARAGLLNFFNSILIVALALLASDAAQRIWALAIGYRIEYKIWTYGIFIGLFISFISNGRLWLIVPGSFIMHHIAGHRLGFFRYDINYWAQAMIALAGPLASILLMVVFKSIGFFAPNSLVGKAILFNAVFAITSMLPIPPLNGSKIYFGSRMLYAFTLPFVVFTSILLMIDIGIIVSISLSLLAGIMLWITYYSMFEKKYWHGGK